ncbi:TPA: hypothetical protein JI243_08560, partial [Acinetobacter baumannii]|nr:hypothetical protein [Acinetobacter baumannii]
FLIIYYLNNIYRKIFYTKNTFYFIQYILISSLFLMFMRGSGFDLFILYIVLGSFYIYLMCIFLKIKMDK